MVRPIDSVNFNVKDGNKDGFVNLSEKTCSYLKFEVDKLPCRHALAAIRYVNKPLPDYCGDFYKTTSWVKAYAGSISRLGILVIGIFLKMCDQWLFFRLFFVRKLEDQERRYLNLPENMVKERPEIVRFIKNRIRTDIITRIHSLVRLCHHAHPHHLQHPGA
ncbi:hypothetical protein Ddye_023933 [Dipteronia dyeriana]|uniref:SWIM-type domain-containing protein n=1 Tax=Dipteronia dyeriana TaxID=168575 RepID=A0AAD9TTU5_9ROSI|nr:hypothetical protein Ddye_023933 [Dipteronia dyeriana]